ncbi:hypothetical protein [Paraburkholderia gardini]|uniref:hypothetical protein n=1 Tax=Paraburkholderia gardini TaxID=2823469 RepID=UPI001E5486B0|nr:hypothetical protein [Paraburkholderia gardini]
MTRLIDKNDRRARQSVDAQRMGSVPSYPLNGNCTASLMRGNTLCAAPQRKPSGWIPEWPPTQRRMAVKHMLQKPLPRSTTMVV